MHAVAARPPSCGLYLPAAQAVHESAPEGLHVPGGHVTQTSLSSVAFATFDNKAVPGAQG